MSTPIPPPVPPAASKPVPPPIPAHAEKKRTNPLVSKEGMGELCPTLHTREEYDRYRASLLEPLQMPLPVVKMTTGYKIGLGLVAFFLIFLSFVYVSAIIGLGFLEYYYFASTFDSYCEALNAPKARNGLYLTAAYFSIPVALGLLILVFLKPLIFCWGGKDSRFEISPEREPLLFEFVEHLCRFVGAPMPKRVFVNCEVNAAAGLSRGIRGALFGGNACDLIIGLPLVAGMSTSEFGGVLAHEFGHFTQAGTRRICYLVQTVLGWFAHIYYYRDQMDVWLEAGSKSGHIINILFCLAIRLVIWLARRVIWCLMTLGNMAAGYMSRQMEYDADSFETRLGGSVRFAQSARKLLMLNIANQKTVADLKYMLNEERLADNYPLLIAVNMRIIDSDLQELATKLIREGKTGFADTHPCDRDRIEAAERWNVPGVLHVDRPASLIFRNFLALSREVSLHFYREEIGLVLEPGMLKNAGAVMDQFQREDLGQKAIANFFQRAYVSNRFLPMHSFEASASGKETLARLQLTRDRMAAGLKERVSLVEKYEKADRQVDRALFFRNLVRNRIRADFSSVDFQFHSLAEANLTLARFESDSVSQSSKLAVYESAAAERLFCLWNLSKRPEVQDRIEDGPALASRMETLCPILMKVGEMQSTLDETRRRFSAVSGWLELLSTLSQDKAETLWKSILDESDFFKSVLQQVRMIFEGIPYPFEHGKSEATLGEFLVPSFSVVESQPLEYFSGVGLLLGRLHTTYSLALGESLAIALAVEDALRLKPLPQAQGDAV